MEKEQELMKGSLETVKAEHIVDQPKIVVRPFALFSSRELNPTCLQKDEKNTTFIIY
jgi:hypothetical protein